MIWVAVAHHLTHYMRSTFLEWAQRSIKLCSSGIVSADHIFQRAFWVHLITAVIFLRRAIAIRTSLWQSD